jgi:uncharacterized protein (DUF302 family)
MARLTASIQSKGLTIFAQIDHAANARHVDMTMNEAQVLFFGSPKAGTVLMQNNIWLALELPLKIAVLQDNDGQVWIRYRRVDSLKARYALPDMPILDQVDALLTTLTESTVS